MPMACRLGDICTGHAAFPPRANVTASNNVEIEGAKAHRQDDQWAVHCDPYSCHDSIAATGSGKVEINGKPAMRVGDPIACGSFVATGSSKVEFG